MPKVILSFIAVLVSLTPTVLAQQTMQDRADLRQGGKEQPVMTEQVVYASVKDQTGNGGVLAYRMQHKSRAAEESEKGEGSAASMQTRKSPGIAFLLSFLIPGLGQHYNGQRVKGAVQEGIFTTGAILAVTLGKKDEKTYNPYRGEYTNEKVDTEWLFIGAGIATFSSLWSMIDAPLSASKINQELKAQSQGHLLLFKGDWYALGLDIDMVARGAGAKLTLNF